MNDDRITLPAGAHLHDRIAGELLQTKSLAAMIWLIDAGRELEFTVNNRTYFLSRSGSQKYVSLWQAEAEQSFDSMEQLLAHAILDGKSFLDRWDSAQLKTLF
ncbi:MAG: hypothetical protein IJD06_08575 [Clostridia bacterium]|nr:hypothetical protein [Clostridia bacterium]